MLPAASCSFRVPWLPLPHLAEFSLCSFFPSLCVLFSPSVAPGSPVLCLCRVKPRGFGKAGLPACVRACLSPSPLEYSTHPNPRAMVKGHSVLRRSHGTDHKSKLFSLDMERSLSFCSHRTLWFRGLSFSSQLSR